MKEPRIGRIIGLLLALILASVAACIRYQPRPIQPAKVMEDFEARRLDSPELGRFLVANKEIESWPPALWDLKALTLAALYYHPDMDVARAQWGVAQGGRITAGERPNPTLTPIMGYNTTSPRSEVTPWIPEVALELTIETAGKRGIRIAAARHLAEASRWQIYAAAWNVRSRLRASMLEAFAAGESADLLSEQEKLQAELVRLLEIQKDAGEVSIYDLTQARVTLDELRLEAIEAARLKEGALAGLAGALGLPRGALDGARLSFEEFRQAPRTDLPAGEIRRQAVINRSDIRAALAVYEASQMALKLEVAKQYPDLVFGPDYQFDQTDSKWTLGVGITLPILSRNRGPIAEAAAAREESAAQFLALQAQVIGELDAAIQDVRAAVRKSGAAEELLIHLTEQARRARTARELGEISKLELLGIELELNAGAQAWVEALAQAQAAVGRLENAAQSPLEIKDWITTMVRPVKENEDD
ncbi:MAG TPA: TolC family protein [Acidobacteriota bacterium]|nr:TolC family protein [Acidobacteriota bacterium]